MAGSVNKVILIGNLGADPEVKSFQNGGRIANLRIATSENWKDRATGERRERHVGTAADKIAARFSVPRLVTPDIAKRLDVDPKDGKTVRVLDKDGKPSALTLVDLEKEFVDNPEFKAILIASKSSGSADTGPANRGSAPQIPTNQSGQPVPMASMSPEQIVAHRAAAKEAAGTQT